MILKVLCFICLQKCSCGHFNTVNCLVWKCIIIQLKYTQKCFFMKFRPPQLALEVVLLIIECLRLL